MMNEFYTYAYLREDGTPYYIGKGKGKRIYSTHRKVKLPKDKSRVIFLKQNLTEDEAFRHETYMIALFGRKDLGTGILRNLTDGGEGSSGAVISEETRRKLRIARKNRIFSEETRRKISEASKNRSEETKKKISKALKGNINALGATRSEETKKKISKALKGKTNSEEIKQKISNSLKGHIPWNKNKKGLQKHSQETREKISESIRGKINSEEHNRKISQSKKGKKWWNNGQEIKMSVECPGDGWVLGRGKNKN